MYIASGDFLTRNTERRVEVGVRIQDRRIAGELLQMLDLQLRDNVNAREMQPDGTYPEGVAQPDASRADSQLGMHDGAGRHVPAMPGAAPGRGAGTPCADSTPPCCRFAAASAPPGSAAPAKRCWAGSETRWDADPSQLIGPGQLAVHRLSGFFLVRKSGLTFAPEAGTQRLRDVINKNVTEEEIERTCNLAFSAGYTSVKLYFMLGLPTETMEDVEGIADTAQRIVDLYYKNGANFKRNKTQGPSACRSPSAWRVLCRSLGKTPFQFVGQNTEDELREKQLWHLLRSVKSRKISVSYHDSHTSFLEAVFAKGDRRLSRVLVEAYRRGCCFDGWDEQFRYDTWLEVFRDLGFDTAFYANRTIGLDEVTP